MLSKFLDAVVDRLFPRSTFATQEIIQHPIPIFSIEHEIARFDTF